MPQAPGPATPSGQGSQAAAETLEGGRQSQPQQPVATAAEGDGVGIPPDAQPLRWKQTKRVKVEVPRHPVDDSASDGIPRARNENGLSYRTSTGSLKVSQWYPLGFVHPPMNDSLGCAGSASCLCCSSGVMHRLWWQRSSCDTTSFKLQGRLAQNCKAFSMIDSSGA